MAHANRVVRRNQGILSQLLVVAERSKQRRVALFHLDVVLGNAGGLLRLGGRGIGAGPAPLMRKELVDGVAIVGIDTKQVIDEVLGRVADVVPPGAQKRIVGTCHLVGKHVNRLVVEWRETAEQRVQHAAQRPHVHTLRVGLVPHDLRGRVADRAAGRLGVAFPDNLAQPKVGDLDAADPTAADTGGKHALVHLVLVVRVAGRWRGRRLDRERLKEQILGFDVAVDHAALLVHVPDALCHLQDHMPSELLTQVRELDNLLEKLATVEQLQHQVVVLVRLTKRDQAHDAWVVHAAHDLHLLQHIGTVRHRIAPPELGVQALRAVLGRLELAHDLDSHLLTGLKIARAVHVREGAVTEALQHVEPVRKTFKELLVLGVVGTCALLETCRCTHMLSALRSVWHLCVAARERRRRGRVCDHSWSRLGHHRGDHVGWVRRRSRRCGSLALLHKVLQALKHGLSRLCLWSLDATLSNDNRLFI